MSLSSQACAFDFIVLFLFCLICDLDFIVGHLGSGAWFLLQIKGYRVDPEFTRGCK